MRAVAGPPAGPPSPCHFLPPVWRGVSALALWWCARVGAGAPPTAPLGEVWPAETLDRLTPARGHR